MRATLVALALVGCLVAEPCAAQGAKRDFGFDLGIRPQGTLRDLHTRPATGRLRLGLPIGESLVLEPQLVVVDPFAVAEGTPVIGSNITLGVGLLYRLDASIGSLSPYVRPYADIGRDDARSAAVASDVGFGLGATLPINDRLGLRLEGVAARRWLGSRAGLLEERVIFGLTYARR